MAEIKYEVRINGKVAKFRRKVPLRDGHVLREFLRPNESRDYYDDVPALKLLLEPCELVPDPEKQECWDDLDTFAEMVPLVNSAVEYIVGKITTGREAKK